MSWTDELSGGIGQVSVATSQNGGMPLEYWAEKTMEKLIYVGNQAPEPLRAQVLAYRDQMAKIVLEGIRKAVENDRIYRK
jgi:hypothetical protein